MNNGFLNFLKKYWLCFLLSVIMTIGIYVSTCYSRLYESNHGMIRFNLRELYLIFVLPLLSLIYGCLSYIKAKRIWIPQLILLVTVFVYWFRFDVDTLFWDGTFIWTVYPVVFSLIASSATAFIRYMIKVIKENEN